MRVSNPVGQKLDKEGTALIEVKIDMILRVISRPDNTHWSVHKNQGQLESKNWVKHDIHQPHDVTHFGWGLLRVHHDFRLVSCVDKDSKGEVNVSDHWTSENDVLQSTVKRLLSVVCGDITVPFFKVGVRSITHHFSIQHRNFNLSVQNLKFLWC